jgi:hypothetical protein
MTNISALYENYQQPAQSTKDHAQSRRIFEWLIATGLAISKKSTSNQHCALTKKRDLKINTRALLPEINNHFPLVDNNQVESNNNTPVVAPDQ